MGKVSNPLRTDRNRSQAPHPVEPLPFSPTITAEAVSGIFQSQAGLHSEKQAVEVAGHTNVRHVNSVYHGDQSTQSSQIAQPQDNNIEKHGLPSSKLSSNTVPLKSEASSPGDTTLTKSDSDGGNSKTTFSARLNAACKRGLTHARNALFHSWMNVLLVFVPAGIIARALDLNASVVFALNAIAIIPLAGLLTYATESVARRLGDTLGALLNVSFGNAVELIIFIIALAKNEIRIVQASLLGSILSNLLLILGMAFLLGGLRYREQIYNSTVTQMSACLLSLSVMSLLLPTAFHASFNEQSVAAADLAVLRISRGTSVILLLVYILYLLFQLKSHAYLYESTPQAIIDEESHPGLLADVLGSSSSSDDSSSSDSSDSDTSGSIVTTSKRIRRKMFHRRRRRSNASASSTTHSSLMISAVSSPSVNERHDNYWEHVTHSSRRGSNLGAIASGDEDTVHHAADGPRVRDFVPPVEYLSPLSEKAIPSTKRFRKKHYRKYHSKHRRDHEKDGHSSTSLAPMSSGPSSHLGEARDADASRNELIGKTDTETLDASKSVVASGKLTFNVRQLSARTAFRPTLPKVLSQNVFVRGDHNAEPSGIAPVPRGANASHGLRRTSSLPDRLGRTFPTGAHSSMPANPSGPLPPYQHTRPYVVKTSPGGQESVDDDGTNHLELSRTAAVILLLLSTGLVAACAEFMVDAIPVMLENNNGISQAFVGLIILPIVSNAAEHVTAVTVAAKNKMDLAIGVAVGSSIQIALFVTPIVVLLGWILKTDMSLYFNLFETISLFVTAFVVNFLVLDGRSNYLEGSLLIAAYVIIAVGAFYYPSDQNLSSLGGGAG